LIIETIERFDTIVIFGGLAAGIVDEVNKAKREDVGLISIDFQFFC
jgi:hypothetical protein